MENNRVCLEDSIMDAVVKMVEGNPGAVRVSMEIINREDPGFIHYLKLDDYGIYGCQIWMCYKDLCGSDISKLYELLKHNTLEDAIREKCQQDETFEKEWSYYEVGINRR